MYGYSDVHSGMIYDLIHACKCTQSCPTLFESHDCNSPDSSVHGIFQARILEWVAMLSSRWSSQPSDWTHLSFVSCIGRWILTTEPPGKPIYDLKYLEKT